MNDIFTTRLQSAEWLPKQEEYVLVGGAGGIGSWLSFMLARAGFIPYVFDFDTVEPHNIGGQLFPIEDVGLPKTEALQNLIKKFTGTTIMYEGKYTSESLSSKFAFAAFDNMQARSMFFENWKRIAVDNSIFIDGRLLAEHLQIFAIRGNDEKSIKIYQEEHLFSDSDVADGPCSFRQTTHVAAMIASLMVSTFVNHYANLVNNQNGRSVPFKMEYFSPIHYFITE